MADASAQPLGCLTNVRGVQFAARPTESPAEIWRRLGLLAVAVAALLPLQTGVHRIGLALGAPGGALVLIQAWKELAILAVVVAAGWTLLSGVTRLRWQYVPGIVLWLVFLGYLCSYALVAQRFSLASLYGFRVYAEPLVGGLALGVVLCRARRTASLFPALALASALAFALATLQVLLPVSTFVIALRRTAADAFGNLPNAFTVSLVNQFRPFATFSDPNDYGFFAALVALISFAPVPPGTQWRRIRILVRCLAVAALALSFSRSALLALIAGGATMAALSCLAEPYRIAAIRLRGLIPVAAAGVILLAGIAASAPYVPQLQHLANTVSRADPSAKGHVQSIADGIREVSQYPAGMGLGLVGPRAGLYGREGKKFHVESSFLQIAAESGLAGLTLYLLAWGATFLAVLLDALVRHRDPERRRWARVAAACLAAQGAAFVFLPTIVSLQTGVIVWTQVGLLTASYAHGRRPPGDQGGESTPATA